MINDNTLKNYIDQVFTRYDRDRSGTLQPNQLAGFFNDIYTMMGSPIRINMYQAQQAMIKIDRNGDGRANKVQLFTAFKLMLQQQATQQQQMYQQQTQMGYSQYGVYTQQNYGSKGMFNSQNFKNQNN